MTDDNDDVEKHKSLTILFDNTGLLAAASIAEQRRRRAGAAHRSACAAMRASRRDGPSACHEDSLASRGGISRQKLPSRPSW